MALDKAELIKRKIERFVKETREEYLDLVLVILSNNGYVLKSGADISFQRYIAKYGETLLRKLSVD